MPHPLITVHNLSYGFAPDHPPAFNQVSFSLSGGELMCLAGINGSGKSTLLRTLAGLYPPSTGTIHIHSPELFTANDTSPKRAKAQSTSTAVTRPQSTTPATSFENSPYTASETSLRQLSALVVQEANMQIMGSTIAEDLELSIKSEIRPNLNRATLEEKARTILSFLHLEHKLNSPIHTLSYGEKRKLCLATAFLRNPALFLLDEPFSGLDYPACLEVLSYITFLLEQGTAIILSTHDTDLIFHHTHKFLFLSPAKASFLGTRHDALQHYAAYGLKPLRNLKGK